MADDTLSPAGRTRIGALLERAEGRFANSTTRALARTMHGGRQPDDPVYQAVVGELAVQRGITIPDNGNFRTLASSILPDIELLFVVVLATMAIDDFHGKSNYVFDIRGAALRERVNCVLDEEGYGYRLTATAVVPAEGPPPLMAPKLKELRAEDQLREDYAAFSSSVAGVGLLFVDVDHFKALNTRLTESVVDEIVLGPLQGHILREVDGRGFAYSVGGDEFIILLRNVSKGEAVAFAERLCEHARGWKFAPSQGAHFNLTISVGVAASPEDASALYDLRKAANLAENRAKAAGRDRVGVYGDPIEL